MARSSTKLLLLPIALAFFVSSLHAVPQPTPQYPYVVNLEINNLLMYNTIVSDMSGPGMTDPQVRSAIIRLLNRYHMTVEHVDLPPVLKTFKGKLKKMFLTARNMKRSGGQSIANQLDKWKDTFYSLKLPHLSGSPTKRKLENDLQNESNKRVKLEEELNSVSNKLEKVEEDNVELQREVERLKNPIKRRRGQRGRGKKKLSYKKSQKYKNRANSLNDLKCIFEEKSKSDGFTPVGMQLKDGNGKLINIHFDEIDDGLSEREIDEMLFILDAFNIPLKGYHEIAQRYPKLPRLNSVNIRKSDLNDSCPVQDFEIQFGGQKFSGVVRSINECLTSVLTQKPHLIKDGQVKIKISGDGTRAGKKKHLVNFSFTIIGEDTCRAEQGNYLLAIVQCPETNECLKACLGGLIEEIEVLESITVNGEIVTVKKYAGGDLKYLNGTCGIASFAAEHSCLWCKCPKGLRFDMSKSWSMSDPNLGARTIEEISDMAKKKKFGCKAQPMFTSIPIVNIVPDTLHLFMRIADQMVYQIIKYLQDEDNFGRLTEDKLKKSTHLKRFQTFIEEIGIKDWKFMVKDSKMDYDSFSGPEHRRIMSKIDFDFLIPSHPKLSDIKSLWTNFWTLMNQLDQDMSSDQIDQFEKDAKEWVKLYGSDLYLSKDVTPYMHILAFHLPEAMRLHGNVVDFCQQGLEKLNDMVTKWYYRSTNYDSTALKQIIHKQHRLRLLEGKCRRSPKFNMTCSTCKSTGHNKRTCRPVDHEDVEV